MPTAVGRRCFFCGARIARDPAWTWSGSTGQIWAHAECAADLSMRIGADIVQWQKRTGRRFRAESGK
jgi:hypothetical protein